MGLGVCLPDSCDHHDYNSVLHKVDLKSAINSLLGDDPKLFNVPLKGALTGHLHASLPFNFYEKQSVDMVGGMTVAM
jgi:hypothetical protein